VLESVIATLAGLVGAGALYRDIVSYRRARLGIWRLAATACGVEDIEQSLVPLGLSGRVDGMTVRLAPRARGSLGTQIVLQRLDIHGLRLSIRRRGRDAAIGPTPGAGELKTGDPSFDHPFVMVGSDVALATAFLDSATRATLVAMRSLEAIDIADGRFRAQVTTGFDEPALLSSLLTRLVEIGRHLPGAGDLVARLAQNAAKDRDPVVRESNLAFLTGEFRSHPASTEALRVACSDPSVAVRLRAAIGLGEEGRTVLMQFVESDAPEACVAEAVSALGANLPADQRLALLDRALAARQLQVVLACVRVMGRVGDAGAEDRLIAALSIVNRDVRIAAAAALGGVGSTLAVKSLQPLERRGDDAELSRTAREAIAMIQDRTRGTPGQISMSEASAGQVSLADDATGRVSLPPPTERDDDIR
jgi:hypothetical protein